MREYFAFVVVDKDRAQGYALYDKAFGIISIKETTDKLAEDYLRLIKDYGESGTLSFVPDFDLIHESGTVLYIERFSYHAIQSFKRKL